MKKVILVLTKSFLKTPCLELLRRHGVLKKMKFRECAKIRGAKKGRDTMITITIPLLVLIIPIIILSFNIPLHLHLHLHLMFIYIFSIT